MSVYAEALLGAFFDTGYHYQFGEPAFDIMSARLLDSNGLVPVQIALDRVCQSHLPPQC